MPILVKIHYHLATFGTPLVIFMDNLVMFYVAFFVFKFNITSAVLFDLFHPHACWICSVDFRIFVALHMCVELSFIGKHRPTMLTRPWITDIVDLSHVLVHCGLWINFSTIFTWDFF